MGLNDINSLSHTRWNCKYHIVFAPKYRRKVFYKESSDREDTAAAVRVERGKNHRGGSVSQPYPLVCRDTAENLGVTLYGVSEREEQHNAV